MGVGTQVSMICLKKNNPGNEPPTNYRTGKKLNYPVLEMNLTNYSTTNLELEHAIFATGKSNKQHI